MPDHKFEAPSDEPLFPEGDPLRISVPGADGKPDYFVCLDRANPPLERAGLDPEKQPVSYLVELLKLQIIEEEQEEFEAAMVEALSKNRVMVSDLLDVARWIGEQRREAEKGTVARVVKRPTRARQRSTP